MARDSGERPRYSGDDRLAAAMISGPAGCVITVVPFVIVMDALDAFHPLLVVAWFLLPGVVGYVAPGLFTRLIQPHLPGFGRRR